MRIVPALALILSAACDDRPPEHVGRDEPVWLSEPAFKFGDAFAGDALFGMVSYLRVSADGTRVFVVEPTESRVTAWTPQGRRLLDLGRAGDGLGDFMMPYRLHLADSGFLVRDQTRFTWFSSDGTLLRTVPNPPTSVGYQGFPVVAEALLEDGSLLARPSIPRRIVLGLSGDDPIRRMPVLRLHESPRGWSHVPIAWRNIRNDDFFLTFDDGGALFTAQPYSDADRYRLDPGAGTVVIVRNAGEDLSAGQAEVVEVSAAGDTVWRRRLNLGAVLLSQERVEAELAEFVEGVADFAEQSMSATSGPSLDGRIEDALHLPDHLPPVKDFFLASSGRVWFESHEIVDTLRVWHTLERGDGLSPPRRVLLPDGFRAMDATDSHVWGVWEDELGINYVVGRRLVARS